MDDLTVILPVYNEKDSLPLVLKEWKKILTGLRIPYHFLICEDGSTDGTKIVLQHMKKRYNLILNQKNSRRGYSKALVDGIMSARTLFFLFIDSDGQCDPKDFPKFWKKRDRTPVLIGWRVIRVDPWQRLLFSSYFKLLFRFLFPNALHDPSAPFVLCRRKTILPLARYLTHLKEGFWWGFVGTCLKKHIAIAELPINHRARIKGETQIYKFSAIGQIAIRNSIGLFKLKFAL